MTTAQSLAFFGIIALTTAFTRALPFLLFPGKRETPAYIRYLGRALPFTIIGMLVVYCLRSVSVTAFPFGLPEGIAIAVIAALHLWKKNTLLSIGAGTVTYMVLVQLVFR
jgi:branched-chain amino acid transport protein azlD